MRKLILAAAAASSLAFAVPASAQTFYAGVGFGPSYGAYDYGYAGWGWPGSSYYDFAWAGPQAYAPAVTYWAPPVTRRFVVVRERPVVRRVVRDRRLVRYRDDALGAYAYSPGYVGYGAPYVGVGVGFGPRVWWRD